MTGKSLQNRKLELWFRTLILREHLPDFQRSSHFLFGLKRSKNNTSNPYSHYPISCSDYSLTSEYGNQTLVDSSVIHTKSGKFGRILKTLCQANLWQNRLWRFLRKIAIKSGFSSESLAAWLMVMYQSDGLNAGSNEFAVPHQIFY